jgi:hypothetical protein
VAIKVVTDWDFAIPDAKLRSHAPARSYIPRLLAGKAGALHALAVGDPSGAPAGMAPVNPQGEVGHDHSGPPYGMAFRHPIFCIGGSPSSSDYTRLGEWQIVYGDSLTFVFDYWCRPYQTATSNAPYSKCELTLFYYRAAGANRTVTAAIKSNDEDIQTESFTASATSATAKTLTTMPRMKPGMNSMTITLEVDAASPLVYVTGLAGNQIKKRSH